MVVSITPVLDTAAYADGDLLFDSTLLADAIRQNGGVSRLESITIVDEEDQGQPLDIYFTTVTADWGTLNSAPSPADATASAIVIGRVAIASGDWADIGGQKVACVRSLGLLLKALASGTDLYCFGVSRGTGDYDADSLVFKFGFERVG